MTTTSTQQQPQSVTVTRIIISNYLPYTNAAGKIIDSEFVDDALVVSKSFYDKYITTLITTNHEQ